VKRIRGWPGAGAAGRRRAARKELQRLERHIERLTAREKELTDLLAAHASGYTRLVELRGELRGVQAEKARLEEDWLRLAVEGEIT
jgi:ATP-binding cassette subfamily F protein uup